MKQLDHNHDGIVALEEFLGYTRGDKFDENKEWKPVVDKEEQVCVRVYVCTCACVCVCACVRACVCACVCVYLLLPSALVRGSGCSIYSRDVVRTWFHT